MAYYPEICEEHGQRLQSCHVDNERTPITSLQAMLQCRLMITGSNLFSLIRENLGVNPEWFDTKITGICMLVKVYTVELKYKCQTLVFVDFVYSCCLVTKRLEGKTLHISTLFLFFFPICFLHQIRRESAYACKGWVTDCWVPDCWVPYSWVSWYIISCSRARHHAIACIELRSTRWTRPCS